MLSIIGIKKPIKQHTADMDITDSVDYKISAPPRLSQPRLLYNPYRAILVHHKKVNKIIK
jgi:hypothetical protein